MSTYTKARQLFNARPELFEIAVAAISGWTEEEMEERCDELMDDTLPEVVIGSYTYAPSQVLREVDPTAYRQEVLTYIDNMDVVEIDDYYFDENELAEFIEQHTTSEVV